MKLDIDIMSIKVILFLFAIFNNISMVAVRNSEVETILASVNTGSWYLCCNRSSKMCKFCQGWVFWTV